MCNCRYFVARRSLVLLLSTFFTLLLWPGVFDLDGLHGVRGQNRVRSPAICSPEPCNNGDRGCPWDPTICACVCSVVIVDVNGDGVSHLTNVYGGVNFDLHSDGIAERVAWTAPGSDVAFLVLDRNGNGKIDNASELFGSSTRQPPPLNPTSGFLASAEQLSCLLDLLYGVEYIKASGVEMLALSRWSDLLSSETSNVNKRAYLYLMLNSLSGLCTLGGTLAVLVAGAKLAMLGRLSVGDFVSASVAARSFLSPVSSCVSAVQQLHGVAANVERLDDVIGTAPERSEGRVKLSPYKGSIALEQVAFAYPGAEESTLAGITLRIHAGETLALVGPTGSGKSTLAMLMLTLLTPSSGAISYDSLPISEISAMELRRSFAFVPQSPPLFRGTLMDNLAFGLKKRDDAFAEECCDAACILDEIKKLPMGFDTLVAENGSNFSGGQKQRIALARALMRRPTVLVLDEATSHLDATIESRISGNLNRLSCTKIVIAHRFSTVRRASHICVLENGRIVEEGSHSELVVKQGHYATMMRAQNSPEYYRTAS